MKMTNPKTSATLGIFVVVVLSVFLLVVLCKICLKVDCKNKCKTINT